MVQTGSKMEEADRMFDMKISCDNNSMVIFPGWVEHGVRKVKINDSDYFDGWGRYAITSFFGCKEKNAKLL